MTLRSTTDLGFHDTADINGGNRITSDLVFESLLDLLISFSCKRDVLPAAIIWGAGVIPTYVPMKYILIWMNVAF